MESMDRGNVGFPAGDYLRSLFAEGLVDLFCGGVQKRNPEMKEFLARA